VEAGKSHGLADAHVKGENRSVKQEQIGRCSYRRSVKTSTQAREEEIDSFPYAAVKNASLCTQLGSRPSKKRIALTSSQLVD
jgi:hypothetical protein